MRFYTRGEKRTTLSFISFPPCELGISADLWAIQLYKTFCSRRQTASKLEDSVQLRPTQSLGFGYPLTTVSSTIEVSWATSLLPHATVLLHFIKCPQTSLIMLLGPSRLVFWRVLITADTGCVSRDKEAVRTLWLTKFSWIFVTELVVSALTLTHIRVFHVLRKQSSIGDATSCTEHETNMKEIICSSANTSGFIGSYDCTNIVLLG